MTGLLATVLVFAAGQRVVALPVFVWFLGGVWARLLCGLLARRGADLGSTSTSIGGPPLPKES